ncbi:MAG: cytochrome C [Proteobacteria bacterium]|nr:MAG: cytochrome C [Pseudomonadota bacterium]
MAAIAAAAMALACSESGGGGPPLSDAAQRGKFVYGGVCIACHNPNPALDGTLGPANAGASRELLEAKILRAEYPPGYTPKRDSKAMPAMPHLADKIDDLTAYLSECCPAQ